MTKAKSKIVAKKLAGKKAATAKKPTPCKPTKSARTAAKPRPIAYARMKAETCPTAPGAAFGGGFYAGRQIGPDGKTYALIVAPKALGEGSFQWKKTNTCSEGALDLFDGLRNTEALNNADHPFAQFCRSLDIGGKRDWHAPSIEDCVLLRRNAMPRYDPNWNPGQTKIEAFKQGGGPEAFEAEWYWTSTQASTIYAWCQGFNVGCQDYASKNRKLRVRAVRKIILI